jgi:microtubule-associated protein-like 6
MGIWPPDANGLDINALDRSHNRQWLVTSDDKGMVKLFNYPCVVHDAPHRAYRGHSSHVMCVRFNCNSSLVCSSGGHDWAVFQFRVVEVKPEEKPPPPPEPVWGPLDASGKPKLLSCTIFQCLMFIFLLNESVH